MFGLGNVEGQNPGNGTLGNYDCADYPEVRDDTSDNYADVDSPEIRDNAPSEKLSDTDSEILGVQDLGNQFDADFPEILGDQDFDNQSDTDFPEILDNRTFGNQFAVDYHEIHDGRYLGNQICAEIPAGMTSDNQIDADYSEISESGDSAHRQNWRNARNENCCCDDFA